jgi:ABC-type glutathione transport system ATPase component
MKNKYIDNISFSKNYRVYPWFSSPNRKKEKSETKTVEVEPWTREYSLLEAEKRKRIKADFTKRVELTKKERQVQETTFFVDLYDKGFRIDFKPGLNLIVGENGCGKSTILHMIKHFVCDDFKSFEKNGVSVVANNLTQSNFFGWDFEKDNPVNNVQMQPNPDEANFISNE